MQIFYLWCGFRIKVFVSCDTCYFQILLPLKLFSFKGVIPKKAKVLVCVVMMM